MLKTKINKRKKAKQSNKILLGLFDHGNGGTELPRNVRYY
jgi:hypothetical protein